MEGYDASTYGDRIAAVYDPIFTRHADDDRVFDVLAELAGPGPALELAIGTGRVAIQLVKRGVEVHGIDTSEAMVAQMRAKPGGADIPVTMGDMAEVDVPGRFPLIYLVFNTFFALPDEQAQRRCMRNVAEHLTDDGIFVIEVFVPDQKRFDRGQTLRTDALGVDFALLEASIHDEDAQVVEAQHILIREGRIEQFPVRVRYAFPEQLDDMAATAGMRMRDRWADWGRAPFTAESGKHITVYERA